MTKRTRSEWVGPERRVPPSPWSGCAKAREDDVPEGAFVLVDGVRPAEADPSNPGGFGGTEEEQRRVARVHVAEPATTT